MNSNSSENVCCKKVGNAEYCFIEKLAFFCFHVAPLKKLILCRSIRFEKAALLLEIFIVNKSFAKKVAVPKNN